MFRCVYIYLYIYISNHIKVLRTCNNFSTCISAALNLFSVRIGVYVMSLYSIELAFIMNCICPCIVLFLLLFILNCMQSKEREGEWRWRGMYGGLLPPLQFRFCSSIVAKSRIQHVHTFCWANKFRLSCLTNFDGLATWWISTLHVCFDSLPIISRVQLNWARHRNTYNTYGIWLLKIVYIFIANNAAATGWREVSSCCALSRDRSTSCYL